MKAEKEKVAKSLELLNFLLKTVTGQKLNVKLTEVEKVLLTLNQLEDIGNSPRLDSLYWNVMRWLNYTKPKKEKTASKPAQGAESLKRKKKGFLPETKKRKNRKKGIQENGVTPGEDGEPAAPEEQPLGTETPKQKKGLVPGGSKRNPNRGGRENGMAKVSGGDLPTANGGDAVADKKKKRKRKNTNRKRKGAAGDEAEQVPAAKKTKGSVAQETQQKQDKAKKKRKEKKARVLQE